jgi:hypothetical protein
LPKRYKILVVGKTVPTIGTLYIGIINFVIKDPTIAPEIYDNI